MVTRTATLSATVQAQGLHPPGQDICAGRRQMCGAVVAVAVAR